MQGWGGTAEKQNGSRKEAERMQNQKQDGNEHTWGHRRDREVGLHNVSQL